MPGGWPERAPQPGSRPLTKEISGLLTDVPLAEECKGGGGPGAADARRDGVLRQQARQHGLRPGPGGDGACRRRPPLAAPPAAPPPRARANPRTPGRPGPPAAPSQRPAAARGAAAEAGRRARRPPGLARGGAFDPPGPPGARARPGGRCHPWRGCSGGPLAARRQGRALTTRSPRMQPAKSGRQSVHMSQSILGKPFEVSNPGPPRPGPALNLPSPASPAIFREGKGRASPPARRGAGGAPGRGGCPPGPARADAVVRC